MEKEAVDVFPTENEQTWIQLKMDLELKRKSHLKQTCMSLGFKMLVAWRSCYKSWHLNISNPIGVTPFRSSQINLPNSPLKGATTTFFVGERHSPKPTWRIIPASKWLVTTIYKPFGPFGRGITPGTCQPHEQ